jgi:CRISPR-associated protein Cmr4
MFEAKAMLFLYAETPLHAGSGSGLGLVDLPVQRERVTGYPLVQGSGVKGALRGEASHHTKFVDDVFGPDTQGAAEYGGALAVGDARLALLPVRSMKDIFAWVTTRDVLERLARDARFAGLGDPGWALDQLDLGGDDNANRALIPSPCDWEYPPGSGQKQRVQCELTMSRDKPEPAVVLEEFAFQVEENDAVRDVATWLCTNAMPTGDVYEYWRKKLLTSLVVLPQDAFTYFTQFATEVVTRVRLDAVKKTVEKGALWSEEHLPPDTLLYAPLYATPPRKPQSELAGAAAVLGEVEKVVNGLGHLQLGGDETVGRGLVCLRYTGPATPLAWGQAVAGKEG